MYTELFMWRLLFTDASYDDTSQLSRFASALLRIDAQLTMKGCFIN